MPTESYGITLLTMYEPRTYRHRIKERDLVSFNVQERETDLYIRAKSNLKKKAHRLILKYRGMLERYIVNHPEFLTSLKPITIDTSAPHIVKEMVTAASVAGVGPMAAVAGALAQNVGQELLEYTPEIIIENGGDIFIKTLANRTIGIYAGNSPYSSKIGIEVSVKQSPLGICTSSGTVGHSLSFGKADAVVALSKSASLADAAATAIGNMITSASDIQKGITFARDLEGLQGIIVIKDDELGIWGEVTISPTRE